MLGILTRNRDIREAWDRKKGLDIKASEKSKYKRCAYFLYVLVRTEAVEIHRSFIERDKVLERPKVGAHFSNDVETETKEWRHSLDLASEELHLGLVVLGLQVSEGIRHCTAY